MKVHPLMDLNLVTRGELMLVHLFTHNSFGYSKPKFGKDVIKQFHLRIVKMFEDRGFKHPKVDFLDKAYK